MILNVITNNYDSVFIHLQMKTKRKYEKHPYFHFELKRQAKNMQGGVIIDFSHISPRMVVENISFLIKP